MQKALALDPLSIIINTHVAWAHAALGRFEEAMVQHEKVIAIDPTSPMGYYGKAYLYWYVYGRLDEAVLWYRKAVLVAPNDLYSKVWLGGLYLDLGDDNQAECWLNKVIKQSPESTFANTFMSYLYAYRGREEQALPYALMAQKNYPTDWETLLLLRDHDLRAGNYDKARSHYEKAHPALLTENEPTIDRGNDKAAIDLAYVLQLSGEPERADLLLDRSLAFIHSGIPRLGYLGYRLPFPSL